MNIVESRTFEIGRFTVRQRPRLDSPGWGQYLIYLGDVLIGKSFSMPDLDCCEWLYLQQSGQTMYAYSSVQRRHVSEGKRGRPRGGRPTKAQTDYTLAEALAD